MIDEVSLTVPRHALSPHHRVRAGEVWRLLQTVAVDSSARRGWPPERYKAEGVSFIVARMTVQHHRQLTAGESPLAHTWVHDFRRGMISRREIRITHQGEPIASTSQQWVHISSTKMKPTRASAAMLAAFQTHDSGEPAIKLPVVTKCTGQEWEESFPCWHSWMDVLSHANHPHYIDWCDEAIMRRAAAGGADPHALVPVMEEVHFRRGVVGGQQVVVSSVLIGTERNNAVIGHTITADGEIAARATTIRRLKGADLAALLA